MEPLNAVISGSFKYKPEIDKTYETFQECGVLVLEPTKGWLMLPAIELVEYAKHGIIRPLPTEQGMGTREIEERFLRAMEQANFVYIMNVEGYVGLSTAFEIGYTLAHGKPLYAHHELDYEALEIDDLKLRFLLRDTIVVMPPEEVPAHYFATYPAQ